MPNPYIILFLGFITVTFFLMLAVKISRAQASHNSPVLLNPSMSIPMAPNPNMSVANIRLLNCVPKELESLMVFVYVLVFLIISVFIYME